MYFTGGKYLLISKVYFPAGVAGKIAGEDAFGQIDIWGIFLGQADILPMCETID
jgi:hypothetical protein